MIAAIINRYILITVLLVTVGNISWANINKFRFFSSEKGLPSDYTVNIIQGNNGFLWIGTSDGLSKFDGITFTNYPELPDTFSSTNICSSFKEKDGTLWFALFNGNLLKFEADTFKEIDLSSYELSCISKIEQGKDGGLWLAPQRGGITHIAANGKVTNYKEGLEDVLVFSMALDKNGVILVGTNEGLLIGDINTPTLSLQDAANTPLTKISCIYKQTETDNYWLGTEDEGLIEYVYKPEKKGYEVGRKFTTNEGLASNNVNVVIEDYEKNLWIGTFGDGVCKISISPTGNSILNIKHFNGETGLENTYINDVYQDIEGNIWLATFGGGIVQIADELFTHYFTSSELRSNNIKTLIKDKQGNFWLGTDQGLIKVNYNNPIQKVYNYPETDKFPIMQINSLFEDIEGNIWIGTFKSGLYRLDAATGEIRSITLLDDPLFNAVNAISGDNQGFVWVSTKGGAYRFGASGARNDYFNTSKGLLHNNVNTIYVDSKDRIWLAAHKNRISYHTNSQFHYLPGELGNEVSNVNCIAEDQEGNLWFGTDGKGVFRYDGEDVIQLTTENGLYSNFCYDIISDDKGKIWIGHRQNISIFNTADNSFSYYGRSEGLLHDKINTNAVYKDDEGNIWFATTKGAIRYNPKFEMLNSQGPITNITAIKVFNRSIELRKNIELPYEEYNMRIEFVGILLKSPEKVKYKYKLEGHDLGWSDETSQPSAFYPKLREGDYTFLVKSSSVNGDWSGEPASFSFHISVPWFRSPWFYGFCFVVLILGVYALVKYRTFRLEQDKQELESIVKERTIEVVAQKEEIERKSTEIAKNAKNITDSIKYAKRIQKAIFPTHAKINRLLPESFVFFRSKGIVSGDFYWIEERKGKVLAAAVDCTGHGVPGAFMSIVANNLLNQAVNEHSLTKPSAILDELNKGISETLHQTYEESTVKDGMDIAMCSIDFENNYLEYAGAYNPLYLVRDGELTEIKGDKFPIGVFVGEELKKFAGHKIDIQKGDCIYIFSDGFADQFGGPYGKKFKIARFRELIINISKYPIDRQNELLDETMREWQGDLEQVDDIVVIGIKI